MPCVSWGQDRDANLSARRFASCAARARQGLGDPGCTSLCQCGPTSERQRCARAHPGVELRQHPLLLLGHVVAQLLWGGVEHARVY